jgi:hypothetical protein
MLIALLPIVCNSLARAARTFPLSQFLGLRAKITLYFFLHLVRNSLISFDPLRIRQWLSRNSSKLSEVDVKLIGLSQYEHIRSLFLPNIYDGWHSYQLVFLFRVIARLVEIQVACLD